MTVAMRAAAQTASVVAVVGRSGVGKTTLLERLLPVLRASGLAVGCVKHASHGFLADRPGKDSYRLFEAGSEAVALISRHQVATFRRRDGDAGAEVSLFAAVATLPAGLDLVLAEGFSWEPIPRVVLVAPGEEPRDEYLRNGSLIDVIEAPLPEPGSPPPFSQGQVVQLARRLAARARARARAASRLVVVASARRNLQ